LLFNELATSYKESIDWGQIHFYWGDERCVPPTDDDSNYKMTRELLLDKVDIPEDNVKRIMGETNPSEEAERYENVIKDETGSALPSFDLIILGMGEDGHTASIFPHQMQLLESSRLCEVATHPESGQKRVTMTGKLINEAQHVLFLVTGSGKKDKIRQIFSKEGPFLSYPASHIDPKGKLEWFLDQDAASEL
jgi:6-phosphogluconolactonase